MDAGTLDRLVVAALHDTHTNSASLAIDIVRTLANGTFSLRHPRFLSIAHVTHVTHFNGAQHLTVAHSKTHKLHIAYLS